MTDRRLRDLEERVAMLSSSLMACWRRLEELERRALGHHAAPTPPAPPQRVTLGPRIPASRAARVLGISARSVRRLVVQGELRGAALPIGKRRRRWTVETADLERLLGAVGCPTAAPAASEVEILGAPRARRGG
jgi:hypothetical protein